MEYLDEGRAVAAAEQPREMTTSYRQVAAPVAKVELVHDVQLAAQQHAKVRQRVHAAAEAVSLPLSFGPPEPQMGGLLTRNTKYEFAFNTSSLTNARRCSRATQAA